MLHSYLSLLKRVRVILFHSEDEANLAELGQKWLRNHFQPTEVGVLPSNSLLDFGIPVNYPQGSTARVFTELSPDVPSEVRDALVLSSCYIAPLIVLGDQGWSRLSAHAFWVRRVARLPDEMETLKTLHLTMNAEAQWFPMAREAYHVIQDYLHGDLQSDALDILLEKRRIQVTQEAERLFSAVQKSENGYPFLFIADPLRLIATWMQKMKRALLAELPWDEFVSAGLGFAIGLVIAPENLRRFLRQEHPERRYHVSSRSHQQRTRYK
ncbi:MAG: hypothetical protein N2116_06135 [Armatimonadetes bacterium]|nr:hypothetical protein [Armatimonadota bacterium]